MDTKDQLRHMLSSGKSNEKKTTSGIKKPVLMVLLALLLFGTGFLVGDGRIQFNSANSLTSLGSSGSKEDLSTEGLQEIYDQLKKNYDGEVDAGKVLDGLKKGAVTSVGDSYTEYMNAEEAKEFNSVLDGKFEGIGAELAQQDGVITVVSPIKDTPAERAGVQPQDIIAEIDGTSTVDMTVSEAVKHIRGEKGTDVKLVLIRGGEKIELTITRDTIDVPSVKWKTEGDIGIIEIGQFSSDTTELVEKAAKEFKDGGTVKKIILDVRGNPGGLLSQAVGVSSVWLDSGKTILQEKRGEEVIATEVAKGKPALKGVPTIVLIDEGSASASEIVAGALKDNGVAKLIGEKSFGKGSVQQVIDLKGGGVLKVTIARWYTPGGRNIDKEGIEPDVMVERTPDDVKNKRDPQLDAAKAGF